MSDEKGKSRAKGNEDGDEEYSEGQPSMLSRVAASATGLTRSAFASPSSNELNERTAGALADAGKGQFRLSASSSGNSAWAESSKAPQQQLHQASSANAFRIGHNEEHIRQSEEEFSSFLNGIDSFTPSETGGGRFAGDGEGIGLSEAWTRHQVGLSLPSQKPVHESVAEQQSRDGEEVLAILAQPGSADDAFEAPVEDDDYDWGLSPEQLSQLRALTKDLFPPTEVHGPINPDNPLNLAPNFEGAYGQPPMGSNDWREQWEGVLNRYTDEVWGGLLPIVKEARKEVAELRNDISSTGQPKALRRLGAILRQLRKY